MRSKAETIYIEKGTSVIPLPEIRRCMQILEYGNHHRIYLGLLFHSLRPGEPIALTWDNFFINHRMLIFVPGKQEKLGHRVTRKIRLSPQFADELAYYKANNTFFKNRLFGSMRQDAMRKYLNKILRPMLGRSWIQMSDNLRSGKIPQYYKYSLYSFRVTIATLLYKMLWDEYEDKFMALIKTCEFMGHKSEKVTATYYIKRIEDLELQKFPDLDLLSLIDHIIYNEIQLRIDHVGFSRQAIMQEY